MSADDGASLTRGGSPLITNDKSDPYERGCGVSDRSDFYSDESYFLFCELARKLPEFMGKYSEMEDACNDDPDLPIVLMALADFVTVRLATMSAATSELQRALAVVESLVDVCADDEIATELIGIAFFDDFATERRNQLLDVLGARSRQVLERLDAPVPRSEPTRGQPGGAGLHGAGLHKDAKW